jgi:hypothetical protein
VAQLPALQPAHELPVPETRDVSPPLFLEKQTQGDIMRRAWLWQRGQEASLSASLNGLISSKVNSQSVQLYSYMGIFGLPY